MRRNGGEEGQEGPKGPKAGFVWHGSGSFTLQLCGQNILVDPFFSRAEEYGPWHIPNRAAPAWDDFLSKTPPDVVLITHGHFDHFDLHTVRRLARATDAVFVANPEVTAVIAREFGVSSERLAPVDVGARVTLDGVLVSTRAGVHWLTGEEGSAAARKLAGRPERYGVMPAGGPMLSFIVTPVDGGHPKVYISGDTEPAGVPDERVDVAILNVGELLPHPATKQPTKSVLFLDDLGDVLRRLGPELAILVHWDYGGYVRAISRREAEEKAASWLMETGVRIVVPEPGRPLAIAG